LGLKLTQSAGMATRFLLLFVAVAASLAVFARRPAHADDVDFVRVFKSERRLELLTKGQIVRSYAIALGGNPIGHKQFEGDQRTPEGRYVLDWRNDKSCCVKSIHISYPNEADKAAAKKVGLSPGGMIMIHGPPNRFTWFDWLFQMFDWTDGCIAVREDEMLEIWSMVRSGTPIEIEP
jgi:murein L,D-transpeptidase YafK